MANYAYASWYGVWAPKGTPADRVATLNTAINQAVSELAKSGAFARAVTAGGGSILPPPRESHALRHAQLRVQAVGVARHAGYAAALAAALAPALALTMRSLM